MHELYIAGGVWHDGDLTIASNGPLPAPGSPLANLADTSDGALRVHYVAADSHMHELRITDGVWQDGDLTSAAGGPSVTPGTAIASVADKIYGTVRVHYIAADAHVHELYIAGGFWYDGDLTAASNGLLPASGSPVADLADANDGTLRVHYVAADSHVHELRIADGVWQDGDLTSVAGGASVAPGTAIASVADNIYGTIRVHYIAADTHVHELYIAGGFWHDGDLTASSNGPLPVPGSPVANLADVNDGTLRVHYVAADSHVHELRIAEEVWVDADLCLSAGTNALAESPLAGTSPTVSLTNLTHPNLSPNFAVGDTFQITVHGAPNEAVNLTQTANGATGSSYMGNTDTYGNFTITGVEQTGNIGTYTQVWSVGGVQSGSAISFMVGQLGGGTVATTDLGVTIDGHIAGVSTLSATSGAAITYSATEMDYTAQLYYDAYTVGTLYENGNPIRVGSASGSSAASGYLTAPATAWNGYSLQTDHYAVAFLVYGTYFTNPLYFSYAPQNDGSGDVVFGPAGGLYYVVTASIYLGSTVADQIDVPQDGDNIPLVDDAAYASFMEQTRHPQQPDNPSILFKVDVWGRAIERILPELFIAESIYRSQHPNNPTIYPLPMALQLVRDTYGPDTDPPVIRHRTYIVRDTNGNRWRNENPLVIYESFQKVGGTGSLPSVNNDPALNMNPNFNWHTPGGDIEFGGEMEDKYSTSDISHRPADETEVDFWQQYWATGFNAPGLTLPGISIPGYPPNAIPLMILGPNDPIQPSGCRYYGTQGVVLRSDYVGINGDHGPNLTCSW